jgi:hypothetical protein
VRMDFEESPTRLAVLTLAEPYRLARTAFTLGMSEEGDLVDGSSPSRPS